MLLGHWYLVQPGLPRRLLNEIVSAVGWVWPVEVVAMLLPVIVCAAMITRARGVNTGGKRPPLLPWFAVVFVLLMLLHSFVPLPSVLTDTGNTLSRYCLVTSMAAIGIKTHLKDILSVGWKPVALVVLETLFLAALVCAVFVAHRRRPNAPCHAT